VSDLAPNPGGVAHDVEAKARAAAVIRGQQAAEHPDCRGLAAAIGTKKTADLSGFDSQIQPFHDRIRAKALGKAVNVDDEGAHCPGPGSWERTTISCPAATTVAWSGRGRASMR